MTAEGKVRGAIAEQVASFRPGVKPRPVPEALLRESAELSDQVSQLVRREAAIRSAVASGEPVNAVRLQSTPSARPDQVSQLVAKRLENLELSTNSLDEAARAMLRGGDPSGESEVI